MPATPLVTSPLPDQRRYRVLKFGGSSLGTPERLARALELIVRDVADDGPVAVVVSALGDSTDHLLSAARRAADGQLEQALSIADRVARTATSTAADAVARHRGLESSPHHDRWHAATAELVSALRALLTGLSLVRQVTPQTADAVASFGERLAAVVVALALDEVGCAAVAVDAREWTVTDDTFGQALVDWPETESRLRALAVGWGHRVPVHTGYIGSTRDGRTTTLGRNGSDYTATLLARGLGARELVRWTDVAGVMTADPERVDDAYPIPHLTYAEALELAIFGAKVFHQRTMIPLMESGIPMRIRDLTTPEAPGTLIDAVGAADIEQATSVTSLEQLAFIGVQWRLLPERETLGQRVLRALEAARVTVWLADQAAHGQSVAVVVPQAAVDAATRAIHEALAGEFVRGDLEPLVVEAPVTLLSLVAESMGRTPNVAGRFFGAIGRMGINVLAVAQGARSRSISAAIRAEDTAVAVRSVHAAFNFSHQEISVLLAGCGTVGSAWLEQVHAQATTLREREGVRVRVVGIANSRQVLFDAAGLDLSNWRTALAAAPVRGIAEAVVELARLPGPILVDCTASDTLGEVIRHALEHGVDVVAANKKPFTADRATHARLLATAKAHHRHIRYETTVGASLPVIETLKDLVRTGDTVHRIEGSFSGTLGFVCHALSAGVPVHEAVGEARRLGYTEPNPAEDLTGLDVARKALILTRELGFDVDLGDLSIVPLVPAELLASQSAEELLERLAAAAPAIAQHVASLAAEGKALRYLARIVLDDGPARIEVGPVGVLAAHPAARLVGTEAFVAFTTARHHTYPLLVQGAGAGAQVTASGVLADVLDIARTLRYGGRPDVRARTGRERQL